MANIALRTIKYGKLIVKKGEDATILKNKLDSKDYNRLVERGFIDGSKKSSGSN